MFRHRLLTKQTIIYLPHQTDFIKFSDNTFCQVNGPGTKRSRRVDGQARPRAADARSRAPCAVDARSQALRAAVTHGYAQFGGPQKGHLDFLIAWECSIILYNAIKFPSEHVENHLVLE